MIIISIIGEQNVFADIRFITVIMFMIVIIILMIITRIILMITMTIRMIN